MNAGRDVLIRARGTVTFRFCDFDMRGQRKRPVGIDFGGTADVAASVTYEDCTLDMVNHLSPLRSTNIVPTIFRGHTRFRSLAGATPDASGAGFVIDGARPGICRQAMTDPLFRGAGDLGARPGAELSLGATLDAFPAASISFMPSAASTPNSNSVDLAREIVLRDGEYFAFACNMAAVPAELIEVFIAAIDTTNKMRARIKDAISSTSHRSVFVWRNETGRVLKLRLNLYTPRSSGSGLVKLRIAAPQLTTGTSADIQPVLRGCVSLPF